MSAIFGFLRLDDQPADPATAAAMERALAHRGGDGAGRWISGGIAMGERRLRTSPQDVPALLPSVHARLPLVAVADARLDDRDALIRELGLGHGAERLDDARLILAAYERWGADCCRHLIGDFAFAIWDGRNRRVVLGRDHLGIRVIYHVLVPGRVFAFATEIKALWRVPGVDRRMDEARVRDYAGLAPPDHDSTCYAGVKRVRSGHALTVPAERGSSARGTSYWSPHDARRAPADRDSAEALRSALDEAVRSRLVSHGRVGCQLSGGLDSSSIAAIACEQRAIAGAELPRTLSLRFAGYPIADESRYIAAFHERWPTPASFVDFPGTDPLSDLPALIAACDQPYSIGNHIYSWMLARLAKDSGCRVVLTGHDGDTVVGYRFAWLAEQFRRGEWGQLARNLSALAREHGVSRRGLLRDHALQPTFAAMSARLRGRSASGASGPAGSHDADAAIQHRMNIASPMSTHCHEFFDLVAGAHGIELRHPFFDVRVVETCLAMPASDSLGGGWVRLVLRQAMEGSLPSALQWRRRKANLGPPLYHALQQHGLPTLRGLLATGGAAAGRWVDAGVGEACLATLEQSPWQRLEQDDGLARVWNLASLHAWLIADATHAPMDARIDAPIDA